jgi:hypothetical protein
MFIRSTLLNLSSTCVCVFLESTLLCVFDEMKEASLVMLLWFSLIIMQVACLRESSLYYMQERESLDDR